VEDGEDDMEGRRRVKISLIKEVPQAGLIHWWSQCFKGGPSIDTTKIQGRKGAGDFQQVWEEAKAKFRQSVEARQPITVDMGDETC